MNLSPIANRDAHSLYFHTSQAGGKTLHSSVWRGRKSNSGLTLWTPAAFARRSGHIECPKLRGLSVARFRPLAVFLKFGATADKAGARVRPPRLAPSLGPAETLLDIRGPRSRQRPQRIIGCQAVPCLGEVRREGGASGRRQHVRRGCQAGLLDEGESRLCEPWLRLRPSAFRHAEQCEHPDLRCTIRLPQSVPASTRVIMSRST